MRKEEDDSVETDGVGVPSCSLLAGSLPLPPEAECLVSHFGAFIYTDVSQSHMRERSF